MADKDLPPRVQRVETPHSTRRKLGSSGVRRPDAVFGPDDRVVVQVPESAVRRSRALSQVIEDIGKRVAGRFLEDKPAQHLVFSTVAQTVGSNLRSDASINSGILTALALRRWRSSVEKMDDAERKRSIAALMAYVAELQAEGVLEGVSSGRLARVVKLVGEAVEVLSERGDASIPIFRERAPAPETGRRLNALEWFDEVWRPRVLAGEAAGDEIRRHDQKFYEALASALHRRGQRLSDILPPSPTRGFKPGTLKERAERRREITRASVRRHRAKKREPK